MMVYSLHMVIDPWHGDFEKSEQSGMYGTASARGAKKKAALGAGGGERGARRLMSLVGLILLLLGMVANVAAGTPGPIRIEADAMRSDQKAAAVHFTGNVRATQDDLVIQADEMTVFHGEAAKINGVEPGQIKKMHARGNVRISKAGWLATGDEVDFFSEERKVLLTGSPQVRQENNMVSGERIVIYLDEGRSVVEGDAAGSGERVKGIFYPAAEK